MSTPIFIGVDSGREIFEFEIQGEHFALLNVPESFPRLVEQLQKLDRATHVICKNDGGWEAGVAAALQQSKIPVTRVRLQDLCAFGGLTGPEEIDIALLVRYGEAHASRLIIAPAVNYNLRRVSVSKPSFMRKIFAWLTCGIISSAQAQSSEEPHRKTALLRE